MRRIAQFDANTIHQLPRAPEYIKALTQHGPSTYIDNAGVEMNALAVDDIVLPIVVTEPGSGNADVCSPYSHYVRYTLEELIKRNRKIPKWIITAVLESYGWTLRTCHLDRVVYINNWLFATNPHQQLSADQIRRITSYLRERYPRHAIVHRTINPYLHKSYYDALRDNGYVMCKSRRVYLIDPLSEELSKRTNLKLDLQLLKRTPYDIVAAEEIPDSEIPRLTELYRLLYIDKHSCLNPQLNTNFFSLTICKNILTYRALRKNGRIDAFVNYYVRDGLLTGAFIGYDINLPKKLGLYRQVIAILISEAEKSGLLLNLSAGTGDFKVLRGAFPVVEYDAVYDRHLHPRRRFAWRLVRMEGKAWSLGL
jgi:hypothetical protein